MSSSKKGFTKMIANDRKTIAVIGASGQQGGAVVRALQADGKFKVRALTRDPARRPDLAEEVAAADLNRPDSLRAAFDGAYGVFLVTDFWAGADELKQVESAVAAAKLGSHRASVSNRRQRQARRADIGDGPARVRELARAGQDENGGKQDAAGKRAAVGNR